MSEFLETAYLACMNTKGGVGKTTTSVFLAHSFASHGARVLVVDLDHQMNATDLLEPAPWVGEEERGVDRTIYDVVAARSPGAFRDAAFPSAWNAYAPLDSNEGVLDVIPGDTHYLDTHIVTHGADSLQIGLEEASQEYDLVIFDCPPSTGPVVQSAMLAATHALLVTESKHLALRSFGRATSFLDEIHLATNKRVPVAGILVTKYDNRKVEDRQKLDVLKNAYPEAMLPVRIPERTAVDAAHSRHIPVMELSTPPARLVANAYITAAYHLSARLGWAGTELEATLAQSVVNMKAESSEVA